jgi:type III restriction enzyme
VKALEERIALEITFPRVVGYRYELPSEKLVVNFTPDSHMALSAKDVPTETIVDAIVGVQDKHGLESLKAKREQEVVFALAKLLLERYFKDKDDNLKPWLFPQLVAICRQWLMECVTCKDDTFLQMLLIGEKAYAAAEIIYQSIVTSTEGRKTLRPILRPYEWVGSTCYVGFDTTRNVYPTREGRCHINYVVCDTESWEQKMAQALEDMEEVACSAKNQNLGFEIPYTIDGDERWYRPDFLVRFDDGHGKDDLLTLIVEVSGEPRRDKAAKVATTRNLWIPAVDNDGRFGRWAFVEVTDPWDAKKTIRVAVDALPAADTM